MDRVIQRHALSESSTDEATETKRVGYQLLAWHSSGVTADGEYDDPQSAMDAASIRLRGISLGAPSGADGAGAPPVEYTAIDEVKTQALHTALADHRRATMRPSMLEDVTTFGFVGRPVASKGSAAGPLHTSSVYDPRRDKPPAKADPKKRRYVNLTNEQLSLLINNEKDGVPSNLDAILMRMLSEVGRKRK